VQKLDTTISIKLVTMPR